MNNLKRFLLLSLTCLSLTGCGWAQVDFRLCDWHHGFFMIAISFTVFGYGVGKWAALRGGSPSDESEPPTDDPWPLDVKCPQCGAKPGMFCDARTESNHGGRYEASPGAHAAKRENLRKETPQ